MNDGQLKKFNKIKTFSLPHNIKTRVMSDVTTAMRTFRAEQRLTVLGL